jgi:ribonuclease HI
MCTRGLVVPNEHVFVPSSRPVEVPSGPWAFARCRPTSAHDDEIVIAVDGRRRPDSATGGPPAAIGVCVGDNSPLNISRPLWDPDDNDKYRPKLRAAVAALELVLDIVTRADTHYAAHAAYLANGRLRQLILKTDSHYLHGGLSSSMARWRENGFVTVTGKRIKNDGLFRQLDRLLSNLETSGVTVLFWLVERVDQADYLAIKGFNTACSSAT